jgi:hypothetical protein
VCHLADPVLLISFGLLNDTIIVSSFNQLWSAKGHTIIVSSFNQLWSAK